MTEAEIRDTVLRVLHGVAPDVDTATLNPGAQLREEADLDSFDYLNFMIELSQKLGVDFPESEYARLTTVNDIVAFATHAASGSSPSS
jgi:acyl carrier protein